MRKLICILLGVLFFLSGCSPSPQQSELELQPEQESQVPVSQIQSVQRQVNVLEIDIASALDLTPSHHYDVYDYVENTILILVYDREKPNPLGTEMDQGMAMAYYCERFVLYDLSLEQVVKEFPVEQFGVCLSAVYAFDGILFTFVSLQDSTISYSDGKTMQTVYLGDFSGFNIGPILRRCDEVVLFSYQNNTENTFGVQAINSNFEITPLLTFHHDSTEYITDSFKASSKQFAYCVAEDDKIIFYLGSITEDPIRFSLYQGDRFYDFDFAKDSFLVSKQGHDGHIGFYLERFDLQGKSIEVCHNQNPLYLICANGLNQFVSPYSLSPVFAYQITNTIEFNSSMLTESVQYVLSNGETFVVVASGYPGPSPFWLLTYS